MSRARCYVSVVLLDGYIYALGGFDGYTRLSSVERYDPKLNQWEPVSDMNMVRSDAAAASEFSIARPLFLIDTQSMFTPFYR